MRLLLSLCGWFCFASSLAAAEPAGSTLGDTVAAAARRERSVQFHVRTQERTGLLVPLYVYPAHIHTNATYNRLMALKRRFETVPIWVILNPASGPGDQVDANYTKAIDRLQGAGCLVLGYVSTRYGQQSLPQVQADLDRWLALYPAVQGAFFFFDEMLYDDTPAAVERQVQLTTYSKDRGLWPTVANPGAETPGRFFEALAADVIVIHEGSEWPTAERLHGDYFGGYSDYPPFTRAVLLHSQANLDAKRLATVRRHARFVYVTQAPFVADDPKQQNPWDRLSDHVEGLCEELARDARAE